MVGRETLERCFSDRGELAGIREVLRRLDVSPDFAQHDDLRPGLCHRLEQDGAHVDVRLPSSRERLEDLGARHFEPVAGDTGLIRHVLRLERHDVHAGIRQQPAQACRHEALAHIRRGAEYGKGCFHGGIVLIVDTRRRSSRPGLDWTRNEDGRRTVGPHRSRIPRTWGRRHLHR